MIILKTNQELKEVFQKIVTAIDKKVKWTETFVINNNNLILPGEIRSVVFEFDRQKVSGTVIDLNIEGIKEEQILENPLLENTLNMTLYAFGKWGEIKGLKVEKDYERLNTLINSILAQVDINAGLTQESFRFYEGGVQITYEEVIQKILDRASVVEKEEEQQDEELKIGLWHNIVWESGNFTFEKSVLTQSEKMKYRLGKNFYIVNYKCPECGEKMHMVVYPVGSEFRIETNDGGVFLSRAYTCNSCRVYYTSKPDKLLIEGDVYFLKFEDDINAYEDYLEVIGKDGARTANCNFNRYEKNYNKEEPEIIELSELVSEIEVLPYEEILKLEDKMDSGFFPEESVDKFHKVVKKALVKVKAKNKIKNKSKKKKNDTPTYEIEIETKAEEKKPVKYSESAKKVLKEFVSKDKDFLLKRLGNLNPQQMEDFRQIILMDDSFTQEEKKVYSENIDEILYKEKVAIFHKRVKSCQSEKYENVMVVLKEIKEDDAPENVKQPFIESLNEISTSRGKKELDLIISNIPDKLTKPQYKQIEERIQQYKEIDMRSYKKLLEDKWDEIEKKKINEFIKVANPRDRKSFFEVYTKLKNQDFETRNIQPVLEKIYIKIYETDQAMINKIFPDEEGMRYSEGLKAYEEISLGDYLPEIKSNSLELIDKRLTKMKMDECELLVSKLSKELNWIDEEKSKIYFNNIKKMMKKTQDTESNVIANAINKYAINKGKYEYPIMVCDSSFSKNGTRGFMLTPDHIYYSSVFDSGKIDVINIEHISSKKNIYVNLKNGGIIRLKNRLTPDENTKFSASLNEFVEYLNEKPESRSISYMAAEKHQVKCCYRCGNVYKDDSECPKCGAKFND